MTDTSTWVPAPPTAETFAARLRLLRLAMGDASIEEMAKRCGTSPATWRTWERGARPHGLDLVVRRICDATGVHRDWLMWGVAPADLPSGGGDDTPPDLPNLRSRCTEQAFPLEEAA